MKEFDKELKEINHYRNYPAMIPFIGSQYLNSLHKKLLIIGESNYFPESSKIHKESDTWYEAGQEFLSHEEVKWIHCKNLLNCSWGSPGHFIYRELNSCIKSLGLRSDDKAISHVAYMNGFQRPASKTGESFKKCCTDTDIEVSIETIENVINTIKPDMIVFVSKYTWDVCGGRIKKNIGDIFFDFVCHPGTGGHYWHNINYKHGKKKFIEILRSDFLI